MHSQQPLCPASRRHFPTKKLEECSGPSTHLWLAGVRCRIHQAIHSRGRGCSGLRLLCCLGTASRAARSAALCKRPAARCAAPCRRPPAAAGTCCLLLGVPPRLVGLQAGPAPLPWRRLVLLLPPVCHGQPGQLASKRASGWRLMIAAESCLDRLRESVTSPAHKGSRGRLGSTTATGGGGSGGGGGMAAGALPAALTCVVTQPQLQKQHPLAAPLARSATSRA